MTKIIVIDDPIKSQKEKSKKYKVPFICLTTHKNPKKQKTREDKEQFIYLPSTKNQRGIGSDVSNQ